jgi:hypothetical protein
MDDFGHDYFQTEMTRAIGDLQHAHVALMRAQQASTVNSEEGKLAWALALTNARSALLIACTISVKNSEAHGGRLEGYLAS